MNADSQMIPREIWCIGGSIDRLCNDDFDERLHIKGNNNSSHSQYQYMEEKLFCKKIKIYWKLGYPFLTQMSIKKISIAFANWTNGWVFRYSVISY